MGMLTMDVGRELTRAGVWDRTAVDAQQINAVFGQLTSEQTEAFARVGLDASRIRYRRSLAMRYLGQFHEILVDVPDRELDDADRAAVETDFHSEYEGLYGYSLPWRAVEILECHLRGSVQEERPEAPPAGPAQQPLEAARSGERECRIGGAVRAVPVYRRELLGDGHSFEGPALVDSATTTILVPDGFSARVDGAGNLVLAQRAAASSPELSRAAEAAS
jgi:N-methylhydantoinase A